MKYLQSTTMRLTLGLAVLLSISMVWAEEMQFTYTLPDRQSICFFQNLAENIQGKQPIFRLKIAEISNYNMLSREGMIF